MRMISIVLLTLVVLCSCAQSGNKKFSFASVGWSITVPSGYSTEDSATYFGQLAKQIKMEEHALQPSDIDSNSDRSTAEVSNYDKVSAHNNILYRIEKLKVMLNSPERMLLTIRDKAQWNLDGGAFFAHTKTVEKDKKEDAQTILAEAKQEVRGLAGQESIIDSSFSWEDINGKKFAREEFTVRTLNSVAHYIVYARMIGNYKFRASFSYGTKPERIEGLLKLWRSSVFKK